jgi:hypothetical protein
MLKQYLIVSYAYLVKIGRYDIEPVEGSTKKVVPEEYRVVVAEYLAGGV